MNRSAFSMFGQCVLALLIALTFAACGGDSGGEEEILVIPPAGDSPNTNMGSGEMPGDGTLEMQPGDNNVGQGGNEPGDGNNQPGNGENGGQGSGIRW